jgi:hypothetical protein
VGVVALGWEPGRDAPGRPAGRLLVDLPQTLGAFATIVGSLAILLWFAFLLALARRRRKEGERDHGVWGTLLFSVIVMAAALWHGDLPEGLLSRWTGLYPPTDQPTSSPGPELPAVASTLFTVAVGALIVAAAFACLGIAGMVVFGDRLTGRWRRSTPANSPLAVAIDESLGDLGEEVDPRLGIIRCYRRFEEALARSRVPRAPWQTPLEFMRDALGRLPLPASAVERLTRLFERARFSNERLAASDRDTAWSSLIEIRESLETRAGDDRAR